MHRVLLAVLLVHFAHSHICLGPLCLVPNQSGLPIKIWHGNQWPHQPLFPPPNYQMPSYPMPNYQQSTYPSQSNQPSYAPAARENPAQQIPAATLNHFDNVVQQVVALDKLKSCRYDVTEVQDKDSYTLKYNLPQGYNLNDVEIKLKHRALQVRGSQGWLDDVQVVPETAILPGTSSYWTVQGSTLLITFSYSNVPSMERRVSCSGYINERAVPIEKLEEFNAADFYRKAPNQFSP